MPVIKEGTLLHIFLKDWVPPLISALVGGLLVAWLLPSCQADFEKNKAAQKRRQELLEATIKDFGPYLDGWRRLRTISTYQSEGNRLPPDAVERKSRYVNERDAAKSSLFSNLNTSKIYFTPEVARRIEAYMAWDTSHSTDTLKELPAHAEWERRRDEIVAAMLKEVKEP